MVCFLCYGSHLENTKRNLGAFVDDDENERSTLQPRIKGALTSDIPKLSFNGIITTVGTGDVMIVLEQNSQPVAILNASYTVAKTLSVMLGNAITQLEELSGNQIMTTNEIKAFLDAKKPENKTGSTTAKRKVKSKSDPRKQKH